MKNVFFKTLCLGLFVFIATSSASFIVDLSSNPNTPVYLTLDAGTYEVTPFAGTYTAWNAWSSDAHGDIDDYPLPAEDVVWPTTVGWLNSYTINDVWYGDGLVYYTPQDALENAETVFFTIATEQTVKFQILDTPIYDNWGGISLNVKQAGSTAVPEPATLMLLGVSLLGIAGVSRKKS